MKCNIVTVSNQYSECYSIAKKIVNHNIDLASDHKYSQMMLIEREIVNLIKIFEGSGVQNIRVLERIFDNICQNVRYTDDIQESTYDVRCIIYKNLFGVLFEHLEIDITMWENTTYFENYMMVTPNKKFEAVVKILLMAPTDLIWLNEGNMKEKSIDKAIQFDKMIKNEYNIEADEANADILLLVVAYMAINDVSEESKNLNRFLKRSEKIICNEALIDVTVKHIMKMYECLGKDKFYKVYTSLKEFLFLVVNSKEGNLEPEKQISMTIIEKMENYEDYLVSTVS